MALELPITKVKASRLSPTKFVLYAPPKAGKTTVCAGLEDSLLLDLENGSDYVDAVKIGITSLQGAEDTSLINVLRAVHKAGKPYRTIIIDTATKLEEWCEGAATKKYKESSIGKSFTGASVIELPNGAGYYFLRKEMEEWLEKIYSCADRIIIIGHLKDKITQIDGREVSAKDIDLIGKNRNIVCQNADAVGYLYRDKKSVFINFQSSEDIVCGSRCDHLRGKKIEITTPDGVIHWDRIYVD